jgi:hypothetical protein
MDGHAGVNAKNRPSPRVRLGKFVSSTAEQKSAQQAPPPCKKITSASELPSCVSTVYCVPRKQSGPPRLGGYFGIANSNVLTPSDGSGVLVGSKIPTYFGWCAKEVNGVSLGPS